MHPIHHAESSARKFGGVAADYASAHQFLDCTKETLCDFRHRALRHHSEGIAELERALGTSLVNSDGSAVPMRYIGEQHVREDMGFVPSVADWLRTLDGEPWMRCGYVNGVAELTASVHAECSARKFGGEAADYLAVHEFMDRGAESLGDFRHRALRHHSQGIFELERVLGLAITNADGTPVPVRYLGEQHVRAEIGFIPTVADWLGRLRRETWMSRGYVVKDNAFARRKGA